MSKAGIRRYTFMALLIGSAATANAATLYVHCGTNSAPTSIGAALQEMKGSNDASTKTIIVTGACSENVLIKDLGRVTIVGISGASITDASNGTRDVIAVDNSNVTLSGLTINGSANTDGVDCYDGSHCILIGGTVQGAYDGVGIYKTSVGNLVGTVLQNNAYSGLRVLGEATGDGITVQGNPVGVAVLRGGRAALNEGDPVFDPLQSDTPVIVSDNATGVLVSEGAEFKCAGCAVRNNTGDGVHADLSAAVTFQDSYNYDGLVYRSTISNNAGVGIYVGDLTSAVFFPATNVSGNGQPDIACRAPTGVTRGALLAAGGSNHTNCVN